MLFWIGIVGYLSERINAMNAHMAFSGIFRIDQNFPNPGINGMNV